MITGLLTVFMEAFVRSRWKIHSQGRGYFWQPREVDVARKIERHDELVTDNAVTMALWGVYKVGYGTQHYLHVSGVDAGYFDQFDRPILHTVIWETDRSDHEKKQIMALMIDHVRGCLEDEIRERISPDPDRGFVVDRNLSKLGSGRYDCSLADHDDTESGPRVFLDKMDVIGHIRDNGIPVIHGLQRMVRSEGLLAAIGRGLTPDRLKHHRYLRLVVDYNICIREAR